MGAWNYGIFDDDTACDALADLKASSDRFADMETYLEKPNMWIMTKGNMLWYQPQ